MSLDADVIRLTKLGTVTITPDSGNGPRIFVQGFEGDGCTGREVAVLACIWAIGVLSRETIRSIERPGGGSIGVD